MTLATVPDSISTPLTVDLEGGDDTTVSGGPWWATVLYTSTNATLNQHELSVNGVDICLRDTSSDPSVVNFQQVFEDGDVIALESGSTNSGVHIGGYALGDSVENATLSEQLDHEESFDIPSGYWNVHITWTTDESAVESMMTKNDVPFIVRDSNENPSIVTAGVALPGGTTLETDQCSCHIGGFRVIDP